MSPYDFVKIITQLEASMEGLSFNKISEDFSISRRTAERWFETVRNIYGLEEGLPDINGFKRWRLPKNVIRTPPATAEELALIDATATRFEQENLPGDAAIMRSLAAKVRATLTSTAKWKLDTDAEALCEAEGLVVGPGPRVIVKTDVIADLRQAILECHRVEFTYARLGKEPKRHKVSPYGLLYGSRHYLVAHKDNDNKFLIFALPYISCLEICNEPFAKPEGFSLREFAAQSFGVYQQEPFEVVWRVTESRADEAREYEFHPTQVFEEQNDGSLIVKFTAGSDLEMCYHLFTWGDGITILEPSSLRQTYIAMLDMARSLYKGGA